MKPRRLAVVAVATASVLALASCTDPEPVTDPASPVASYPDRSEVSLMALLSGYLVVVDGCLLVSPTPDPDDAPELRLPVFPAPDTEWDVETQRLTFDRVTFDLGSYVEFGGGSFENWASADVSMPEACLPFAVGDAVFHVDGL